MRLDEEGGCFLAALQVVEEQARRKRCGEIIDLGLRFEELFCVAFQASEKFAGLGFSAEFSEGERGEIGHF